VHAAHDLDQLADLERVGDRLEVVDRLDAPCISSISSSAAGEG
jgi:hypothetical protein